VQAFEGVVIKINRGGKSRDVSPCARFLTASASRESSRCTRRAIDKLQVLFAQQSCAALVFTICERYRERQPASISPAETIKSRTRQTPSIDEGVFRFRAVIFFASGDDDRVRMHARHADIAAQIAALAYGEFLRGHISMNAAMGTDVGHGRHRRCSPRNSPITTSRAAAATRPSTLASSAITTSDDEVTSPLNLPSIRTGSLKISFPDTLMP